MKKLEYKKENLRSLAFIISKATSGSQSTKLLKDAGWVVTEEWQLAGKSKESFLFDEFIKIGELGRLDILDFVVEKTISKDPIYFKIGDKEYRFPREPLSNLKKQMKLEANVPKKANAKLFIDRKYHGSIIFASKQLFIDGHYSQAIFESCKLLNRKVQEISGLTIDGKALMQQAFSPNNPLIKLNDLASQSDKDEQEGFMHLFAGTMHGIRNPKGHEVINLKDPYKALDYLSFISLLFKRLDERK